MLEATPHHLALCWTGVMAHNNGGPIKRRRGGEGVIAVLVTRPVVICQPLDRRRFCCSGNNVSGTGGLATSMRLGSIATKRLRSSSGYLYLLYGAANDSTSDPHTHTPPEKSDVLRAGFGEMRGSMV